MIDIDLVMEAVNGTIALVLTVYLIVIMRWLKGGMLYRALVPALIGILAFMVSEYSHFTQIPEILQEGLQSLMLVCFSVAVYRLYTDFKQFK